MQKKGAQKGRQTPASRVIATQKIASKSHIKLKIGHKQQDPPRGYVAVLFAFRQSTLHFRLKQFEQD